MFPAARVGDLDIFHCSVPVRGPGSPNVLVNFRTWNRMGDFNLPHLLPCGDKCCVHAAPIAVGSTRVFVNGRGAARVTDYVLGCTAVATGAKGPFGVYAA